MLTETDASRMSANLARVLAAAVDSALRGEAAHPVLEEAARRVRGTARQLGRELGPVVLDEDSLKEMDVSELMAALKRHRVRGVAVLPAASARELRALVGVLTAAPGPRGLALRLKERRVGRIWPVHWPVVAVPHRDRLAAAQAALEAVAASGRLDAELQSVVAAGLRALEALSMSLETQV